MPALQSTDLRLTDAIRNSGAAARPRAVGARWRSSAVGVQVAVSTLLVVAALFLRATQRSTQVAPGFDLHGVASVAFNLEQVGYDSARAGIFFDAMRQGLLAEAGVERVAAAQLIPLRGRGMKGVQAVGVESGQTVQVPILFNVVTGDYFSATGIQIVRGRPFTPEEVAVRDPSTAVVSEAFARAAWGTAEPLGRTILDDTRRLTVVGVARDVQSASLGTNDGPFVYTPASSGGMLDLRLVVRAPVPTPALRRVVERVARRVDPSVIPVVRGFDDELDLAVAPIRLAGELTSVLGGVALLLAAIGVYGVVTFAVSQRTREIGIRMALGATRRNVRGLVLHQGARVAGVGLLVGLALSAGAAIAIQGVLFGLHALDLTVFSGVALALMATALVAVGLPAIRASRIDPMTSLRED
ncbi:MAG: FtsX-like permease family protein [Gemmatimonadaceae bacterium]